MGREGKDRGVSLSLLRGRMKARKRGKRFYLFYAERRKEHRRQFTAGKKKRSSRKGGGKRGGILIAL